MLRLVQGRRPRNAVSRYPSHASDRAPDRPSYPPGHTCPQADRHAAPPCNKATQQMRLSPTTTTRRPTKSICATSRNATSGFLPVAPPATPGLCGFSSYVPQASHHLAGAERSNVLVNEHPEAASHRPHKQSTHYVLPSVDIHEFRRGRGKRMDQHFSQFASFSLTSSSLLRNRFGSHDRYSSVLESVTFGNLVLLRCQEFESRRPE